MNDPRYEREAQHFVDQHLAAGDLFPTLATYIDLATQKLRAADIQFPDIESDLMSCFCIVVELDRRCELRDRLERTIE